MIVETVYQHHDWVLLNKPQGYSIQYLQESLSPQFREFHPVHRLDKDTSGLWLIALNREANQQLSLAFQNREVEKSYLALTHKKPKKKQGTIIGDMVRSRRGQWQLLRTAENPAITWFRSTALKDGKRLVLCKPETGKTHQIRVAMKSIGSPIAGDSIYDAGSANQFDRLYLHAYALSFCWQAQYFYFQLEPDFGELFSGSEYHQAINLFTNSFAMESLINATI